MPGSSSTAHSTAHNSTARRQRNSTVISTHDRNSTARQLLDAQAHGVSLGTGLTGTRQARQGSTGKASTAPRQRARQRLDGASTARQLDSQGSNFDNAWSNRVTQRLRFTRCPPPRPKYVLNYCGVAVPCATKSAETPVPNGNSNAPARASAERPANRGNVPAHPTVLLSLRGDATALDHG